MDPGLFHRSATQTLPALSTAKPEGAGELAVERAGPPHAAAKR